MAATESSELRAIEHIVEAPEFPPGIVDHERARGKWKDERRSCLRPLPMQIEMCFAHTALLGGGADAHAVEAAVDEDEGDDEEDGGQDVRQAFALGCGQLHGEFDGEEAEERRELDDRVEGDGGGVLEGIADGVADDCGVVERRAFLLQFDFDDFLGVVPGAAGVGHEDGLVEAEDGDGEQVADEEEGLDEGEGQAWRRRRR